MVGLIYPLVDLGLKVSKFLNEFLKSSFLPKYEPNISRVSVLYTTYRAEVLTIFGVRNHVKLGVSLRVLYCVVDTSYGLGRSLGDCRPALPKGRKYQMVKTQCQSHVRRPVV